MTPAQEADSDARLSAALDAIHDSLPEDKLYSKVESLGRILRVKKPEAPPIVFALVPSAPKTIEGAPSFGFTLHGYANMSLLSEETQKLVRAELGLPPRREEAAEINS